jgi:hypothetical protein
VAATQDDRVLDLGRDRIAAEAPADDVLDGRRVDRCYVRCIDAKAEDGAAAGCEQPLLDDRGRARLVGVVEQVIGSRSFFELLECHEAATLSAASGE